ncbi:MAG: bifunctional phosphoribosylaminoimidazolecarboxamide formyltransferase/IMP cyclohydrolase [Planctomycetes bacterium]|nr:bifunctional phosphoribosylaminoimidazolecarboxamide formyltransferase/IMP cyclohydrolase [Planctomycetota bacterium]
MISVSDKSGLADFARGLAELGFELVSTGGTRRALEEAGLAVLDIAAVTGFPEILDGRVKTLHPLVHGGLLGRPDRPADAAAIAAHGIVPIELVVCNLYPFEQTIAGQHGDADEAAIAEAIKQIDIGGPSMIRSAAKNHAYVAVVTDPGTYDRVLEALRAGPLAPELRRELAAAAFERTARYDRAIADWFARIRTRDNDATRRDAAALPETIELRLRRREQLRYGENPHQRAALYVEGAPPETSLAAARQRHGKELSYNNLLDLDAALGLVREFAEPAAVVIKHTNPCGCGIGTTLAEAFERAYAGDPVSAFGSILAFNRSLDAQTAEELCRPGRFIEAILAPAYGEDAFELLTTRPKWKNSVRLIELPGMIEAAAPALDYRRISGGLLVQDADDPPQSPPYQGGARGGEDEWQVVTRRRPSAAERSDLAFAWRVVKHVKSNAIVLASGGAVVGVGAGQMSRVDAAFLAAHKASERSRGAVLASDAFFPFRDGVDEAARAGVTAIVQPGGSRGDDETIVAADEHGLAMLFTGRRHFRH